MSDRSAGRFRPSRSLIAFLLAGAAASVAGASSDAVAVDGAALGLPAGARLHAQAGITRMIAGVTFTTGESPRASAEAFLQRHGHLFGQMELVPGSLAGDGLAERPIMPTADGSFKHTIVSYLQRVGEVPVFEAEARFLVRNEPGFPLVLAASTLKPIDGFSIAQADLDGADAEAAFARVRAEIPELARADFEAPDFVVWAGTADTFEAPRLAMRFMATAGEAGRDGYAKRLIIADAATGEILHVRDQILHVDIQGTVRGMSTEGYRSAFCNPEVPMAMPFARVTDGTTTVFADRTGAFSLPRGNNNTVNVTASLRGRWFRIFSPSTDAPGLTVNGATPPGPVAFMFNDTNTVEVRRSEVNAYFHCNYTRSQCLDHAPTFPTIGTQTEFRVNVNLSAGTAYYDGASINLGRSGSGIDSLAMADVVEHEYGHHLVGMAGSGQGQYGEGYGDLMALMTSESPINGRGYDGASCETGVRTADNTIMFPCSNEIHTCGQLLTGCFWEFQEELMRTRTELEAKLVMRPLAYNSVLLHQGDQISPATVTEVILALDDTDGNVNNGTPHVFEILTGFERKNMEVALPSVTYSFPGGVPDVLTPGEATPVSVRITTGIGQPLPETARIMVSDGVSAFAAVPLTPVSPGSEDYTGILPAFDCGDAPRFYFAIDGAGGRTFNSPATAPVDVYSARVGVREVRFVDDGEADAGFAVSGPVVRGAWGRDVPSATGTTGAPRIDGSGNASGRCWLTGNDAQDVDGTSTILTSPRLDARGGAAVLSYDRWFYNSAANQTGNDPFVVEISADNGATWQLLEQVGPTGSQTHGGWNAKSFELTTAYRTDAFRVRFVARDGNPDSTVEAAIDNVKLTAIDCQAGCEADFNGDNFVDFFDYDDFVNCFETATCPAGRTADFNGDDFVDFFDYDAFVVAFETGC